MKNTIRIYEVNSMKCPFCAAETKAANYCEYCGSELPQSTPTINITNNYYGPINTSSESIEPKENKKKKKGCLWWFLMFCIWPIALSIWFYKTDKVAISKKWKIIIIVVFWIFMLALSGSSEETETTTDIDVNIQNNHSGELADETITKDKSSVIDMFIFKFNEIATIPMTDSFEIDIHDKEAEFYRTEFRLTAFDDAKAKRCKIGEDTIDIICTQDIFDNFNIRIYFNTNDKDIATDVFYSIALNVYPDLTEVELTEVSNEIHQHESMDGRGLLRDINYYYLGELFMDNVMYSE